MQGKRRHSELLTPKINISAESLFKVLIFQQQKTINELIAKVSERKERSSNITRWMNNKDTG